MRVSVLQRESGPHREEIGSVQTSFDLGVRRSVFLSSTLLVRPVLPLFCVCCPLFPLSPFHACLSSPSALRRGVQGPSSGRSRTGLRRGRHRLGWYGPSTPGPETSSLRPDDPASPPSPHLGPEDRIPFPFYETPVLDTEEGPGHRVVSRTLYPRRDIQTLYLSTVHLPIYLTPTPYLPIHPFRCLSTYLPIFFSNRLPTRCLSVHLPICLSEYLPTYLLIYLPTYLSTCLFIYLLVYLFKPIH